MFVSIMLFTSIAFSLIFNGYLENIFIVLATILIYKQIIIDKQYKYLGYSLIISFISSNFIIYFLFNESIESKEIDPLNPKDQTLVLLVSEGEDIHYNVKERTTQIYDENGYKSFFTGIRDLSTYKKYYEDLGHSNFKEETNEIKNKLSYQLGNDYKIVNSHMYSKPYFENILEDAVDEGYKKIIICPIFMTEGKDYEAFKKRYEKLNIASYELDNLQILEPLYKSNNLALAYKNEILKNIRQNEEGCGVLLIGLQDKNNLEQDVLFRQKIKEYIEYEEKNIDIQIKLPLLENNKNDIIKCGEELLEYGIHSLYVALPTNTIDTMYTKNLVNSILEELDMGHTKFYYIDPYNKIDTIVDELFTKISLINEIGG